MSIPGFEDDDLDTQHQEFDPTAGVPEDTPEYEYLSAGEFLHQWLIPRYQWAKRTNVYWCSAWWSHAEALDIITDLHDAWEERHHEPASLAGWKVNVLYPLMDRLTSERGPFKGCTDGHKDEAPRHRSNDSFTCTPWPDGFFTPKG